ncbi:hypothetical protein BH20ACI2_BH20ACI2_16180 [soil metagenome]
MRYPRISSAIAIDDHTLLVEFDNAAKRLYDIRPLFAKEYFTPLKNFAFFKAVKVDTGGYAVYWNEDIDLSEHEIWSHGKPV